MTEHFQGQRSDEVVVLVTRRHWSVLAGRMVRWALLALLPGVVQLVLSNFDISFTFDPTTTMGILLTLGGSAYLLIVLVLAYQDWVDYELDALFLTNERVLKVEQDGMFHRTMSQLTLDRIQDVTVETKGILSTIFGFGSVTVESAGEEEHFVFTQIPHVEAIQSQLLHYAKSAPRLGVERQPNTDNPTKPTDKP